MTTLNIGRFQHRMVVPATVAAAARPQLDRSVDVLLRMLPEAIAERRVPPHALVCLRSLSVRLNVATRDLADTTELARLWAEAIADGIEEFYVASGSGPDGAADDAIVVYRNRSAALADLVLRVALGDLRRRWAWEQLGLCSTDGTDDPADLVVAACLRAPDYALPVLAWAARRRLLDRLGLTWPAWYRLARGLVPVPAPAPPSSPPPRPHQPEPSPIQAVSRILEPSPVVALLRRTASRLGAPDEPIQSTVTALVLRLSGHQAPGTEEATAVSWVLFESETSAALPETRRATALPEQSRTPPLHLSPPEDRTATPIADGAEPGQPAPADEHQSALVVDDGSPLPAPNDGRPERPVPEDLELDTDVWTARGGLLFLLNLAGLAGVVAQTRTHARGHAWCLVALGMRLAGTDSADPAVRVFAGLPVGVPLDRSLTEVASEEHERQLVGWVDLLDAELAARLPAPIQPPGTAPGAEPLARRRPFLVRRTARLLIDPGWIEAELPLDTVDIDVRRAGLDFDPSTVPHLGSVVRFRYV